MSQNNQNNQLTSYNKGWGWNTTQTRQESEGGVFGLVERELSMQRGEIQTLRRQNEAFQQAIFQGFQVCDRQHQQISDLQRQSQSFERRLGALEEAQQQKRHQHMQMSGRK